MDTMRDGVDFTLHTFESGWTLTVVLDSRLVGRGPSRGLAGSYSMHDGTPQHSGIQSAGHSCEAPVGRLRHGYESFRPLLHLPQAPQGQ